MYIFQVQLNFSMTKYSRNLHNLWSNHLMIRVYVYKTRDPMFKTLRWLKNCLNLLSFKGQSNEYQGFLGTWCLKVSTHCDSAACKLLNSNHKVVHYWDKWTLKRGHGFLVKYTSSILLMYSWSILQAYIQMLI